MRAGLMSSSFKWSHVANNLPALSWSGQKTILFLTILQLQMIEEVAPTTKRRVLRLLSVVNVHTLIFVALPLILAACYNFTTIDVPSAFRTIALGINNAGYVVGSFDDVNGTHGFVRDTGGNFTTIDFPNASSTEAHGINDAGEVIGNFGDGTRFRGFVRDITGSFTVIEFPGISGIGFAFGINNPGQLVGKFLDAAGTHGFIRQSDGNLLTIDVPGSSTAALGINNAGQVVGYFDVGTGFRGFLRNTDGNLTIIEVPGALYTEPFGINNNGEAVGLLIGSRFRGFLRDATGSFTIINVPAASYTEVHGINDTGLIVGSFDDATGPSVEAARIEAFRQGLRELGYVEGKNIIIEWRWAEGKFDRLPDLAAELVPLDVDVIVTGGSTSSGAAKEVTTTIPIVMAQVNDPVGSGFVASLARPGGNMTGLSTLAPELSGKRLELLKEVVPRLSHVAVFGDSTNPGNAQALREVELAAKAFGVKLQYLDVLSPKDIETAFRAASKARADAVLMLPGPVLGLERAQLT